MMSTPRKSCIYNLPYANSVKQYPSQSEDYISLDMGGPKQNLVLSSNEKTPGHYNTKYYQHNYRNSNSKGNKRNLFSNPYGQQNNRNQQFVGSRKSNEWQQQNIRNSNESRPQQHQKYEKKDTNSIDSYIHPSMIEDPWSELTQRFLALGKSKISLTVPSPSSDKCPNSNSDEDQEADSATSSGNQKFSN